MRVVKDRIGLAAGEIWNYIEKDGGSASLARVREKTGLDSDMAYLALGWLAREEKVTVEKRGRSVRIVLVGAHVP